MRIEHVTILVSDREKSLNFFQKILGFRVKYVGKHAWVVVGDQYIHITENSGKPVGGTFYHFCIESKDIASVLNKIKQYEIEIIDEIPGKSFFVRDLDGNLIEFAKPRH